MRQTLIAALVGLAAAPFLAPLQAVAEPQTIAPGYWETTSKVLSPFPSGKTEKRCIGPEQVAKFMEGPGNHIYHCTYPTKLFHDGQIKLEGSCKSRDGAPFPIEGAGTYSRESFHLEVRAHPSLGGGMTLPVHAVSDAHRLGDTCPAPDKPAAEPDAGNAGGNTP